MNPYVLIATPMTAMAIICWYVVLTINIDFARGVFFMLGLLFSVLSILHWKNIITGDAGR